jgi:geranylgeranyl pyrophosphate synthase
VAVWSDYSTSLKSLQLNSRSMEKILDGELGQMDDRYKLDQTVEEYLENISGKTAELFALSCSSPSRIFSILREFSCRLFSEVE